MINQVGTDTVNIFNSTLGILDTIKPTMISIEGITNIEVVFLNPLPY
jgi:hypothetical protein